MQMLIGVDFDNTIVCYDQSFQAIAQDRGLIPPGKALSKREIHDHLHGLGQADVWTGLQGEVYGPLMSRATAFPGVMDFFKRCRTLHVPVRIISHRTRYPYMGEKHDLHLAARNWLESNGFYASDGIGLSPRDVFFEESRAAKLARIAEQRCTHFLDDLVEVLAEEKFPAGARKILFDPNRLHGGFPHAERAESWTEVETMLLPAK
jgi:hypothetical protein